MIEKNEQPTINSQLNIVLAFIGLCLGFTYFLPNESVNRIIGFVIGENLLDITVNRLILVVTLIVSAAGASWYLTTSAENIHDRVKLKGRLPHLVIPVFTSVTLAYTLSQMVRSPWWWVVFLLGIVLLAVVLVSEQAELSRSDQRMPIPTISLITVSIGLYLLGLIVLRTIGPRLYVLFPLVLFATAFVAYRFIKLRSHQKTRWETIGLIAVAVGQVSAALYYLFINALQFGLLLTGLLYALVTLAVALENNRTGAAAAAEPLTMLLISLVLTGLTLFF